MSLKNAMEEITFTLESGNHEKKNEIWGVSPLSA